ncbi:MAG: ABC transporter ATP-binding protein [Muribaculaceae bacterium]|nr:ABC transporter ATP-binding protein [Muribaculaceae bacterium]
MIQLKNFSIGYANRTLLKDVNAEIAEGKLSALLGRNGTGKSTLLKAIAGLNQDYKGEIIMDGKNIKKIPKPELASIISYVNTQRPRIANLRCKDVVALGRSPYTGWHGILREKDKLIINKAIEMVGMKNFANRYFNSLSDGECQKVMIARSLAQDTPIILLDEPTSFLDLPARYELISFLKKLSLEEKKTIFYSTHELDVAAKFSDFVALIVDEKLEYFPATEMSENPHLKQFLPE